jgi:hypothetical protein
LTVLKQKKETFRDTTKTISYYPNGAKKEEDWEIGYNWIFHADYCKNGALRSSYSPNDQSFKTNKNYFCDGTLSFKGDWEAGRYFGDQLYYHPNGKLRKVVHLKPYSKKHEERLKSQQIKSEQFDTSGNEITSIPDTPYFNINVLGAPTYNLNNMNQLKKALRINDLVSSGAIVKQVGYSKFMTSLKLAIYKNCKVDFKTECSCGESLTELIIDATGTIKNVRITRSNRENIDEMFIKAILELKTWEIGEINSIPRNVLVKLNLKFENVK